MLETRFADQLFNNIETVDVEAGGWNAISDLLSDYSRTLSQISDILLSIGQKLYSLCGWMAGRRFEELSQFVTHVSQKSNETNEFIFHLQRRIYNFEVSTAWLNHEAIAFDEPIAVDVPVWTINFDTKATRIIKSEALQRLQEILEDNEQFRRCMEHLNRVCDEVGFYWKDPQYEKFKALIYDEVYLDFQQYSNAFEEHVKQFVSDIERYVDTNEG